MLDLTQEEFDEAIEEAKSAERDRILNLIRAKHGRDWENHVRRTIGLPSTYDNK